jgi:hypothetical protein
MKEIISHLPVFNPWEDKQTLSPPFPTESTVDPPADESPTYCHAEDALPNAYDPDESTGQVESIAFKTKNARVDLDCYIDSDRQGPSNPKSKRSSKPKALKPVINPLSTKSKITLNSNISESQQLLQNYIP